MSVPITVAIDFVLTGLEQLARASAMIKAAQEQGRSEFTRDEWDQVTDANDLARAAAQDAVDQAIAEGR